MIKKKRIVMLLSNVYNPDDRVRNEALALAVQGYQIDIIAWDRFKSKPKKETLEGINIYRVSLRSGYGQTLWKFFTYCFISILFLLSVIALKPDVIHCHDFDTFFIGLLYTIFVKKCKFIFDAHENYSTMMKPLVSKSTFLFVEFLERKSVKYTDLVIAACQATGNHYKKMGAKNVIVIGNWKNPDAYKFLKQKIADKREDIGAGDRMIITYIGSLTEDRNVLPLIQAVKSRPRYFLVIGGIGGQEEEIREHSGNGTNIYFPGYIHPDEVPLFTATSDVIYYGLGSSDPYAPYNAPNKLFEALAAGKPILACDLGGELSEVLNVNECGLLISKMTSLEIGNALDQLLKTQLRNDMASKSKVAGEIKYNWKIGSQKLIFAYDRLLKI